eukprot:TRINITY_DN2225_c0_g4_i2.p1 TRINITY_DN2225_c0_g4~~TRINITY_DN2225_c0_g4_i2.p1  ORF type:complete len:660 (+),score=101.12 TRINITY_DN2225_c0_g4_i2:165-2144(+)
MKQGLIIRVGAVAFVSATVAILFGVFWRRCKKQQKDQERVEDNEYDQEVQQALLDEPENKRRENTVNQLKSEKYVQPGLPPTLPPKEAILTQNNTLQSLSLCEIDEIDDGKTEVAIGTPRDNDIQYGTWSEGDKVHQRRTAVAFPDTGQPLQYKDGNQFPDVVGNLIPSGLGEEQKLKTCLKLLMVSGPSKGVIITFEPNKKRKFFAGRSPDCDFFIQDVEVSSRHLRFDWREAKWFVCDTGSLNGTQINGRVISKGNRTESESFLLQEADELTVGRVSSMRVQFVEPARNLDDEIKANHQIDGQVIQVHPNFPPHEIQSRKSIDYSHLQQNQYYQYQQQNQQQQEQQQNQLKVFGYISQVDKGLSVRGAGLLRQGKDHIRNGSGREDYYMQQVPLKNCGSDEIGLICVFDGHGGPEAAQHSIKSFPKILSSKILYSGANLSTNSGLNSQINETFLEVDRQIDEDSGCTATILVFQKNLDDQQFVQTYFQAANVGDSSAIAIKFIVNQNQQINGTDSFQVLTQDHKVRSEGEKQRLDQLGVVRSHGGSRIYGLNLARTIGDRYVKEEAELTGVIADPFICEVHTVKEGELSMVVMATDGLWDVMSYEQVAQVAQETFIIGYKNKLVNDTLPQIAEELAEAAVQKGSRDDIGIVVLLLEG